MSPRRIQISHYYRIIWLTIIALIGYIASAQAQIRFTTNLNAPIIIRAENLTLKSNVHVAHFENQVTIEQGGMMLHGQKMQLTYQNDKAHHLHISGGVVLKSQNREHAYIEGEQAIYDIKSQMLTIIGNIRARSSKTEANSSMLSGARLEINLADGYGVFSGDDDTKSTRPHQRVRGRFAPSSSK